MRLYEIAATYRDVMARIEVQDGEVTDDIEAALDAISEALPAKIDAVAKVRAELLAEAAAVKEEEARLRRRREAMEKEADRLKEYLGKCLHAMGERKVKTATHTVYLQATPPKLVLDIPEDEVPDEWLEYVPRLRRKEIADALKKNEKAVDWAHLETGETVRIR